MWSFPLHKSQAIAPCFIFFLSVDFACAGEWADYVGAEEGEAWKKESDSVSSFVRSNLSLSFMVMSSTSISFLLASLSVCQYVYLFACPPDVWCHCVAVSMSTCLPVHQMFGVSVWLSVCLPACLSIRCLLSLCGCQ